jgi:undecaprenyl-diphosphatase
VQLLEYALLGIIQGLTEFLPVSSKSHLLLAQMVLGIDLKGVVTEVALHVATLLSVLIVYGRDVVREVSQRNWNFIVLITLSTAVTVGLIWPWRRQLEALTQSEAALPLMAGLFLVTAAWLILADWRLRRGGERRPIRVVGAILLGLAQAIAILPGISRSGATIGMALQAGEEREHAARYSFVLSIPVILGAAVLKTPELLDALEAGVVDPLGLTIGFIAALTSGVLAIYLVLWMLRRARLVYFAAYCIVVSAACFAWWFNKG